MTSIHTKWKMNPEIVSGKLDNELVIMEIEQGKYFGINPVGTRILEILEKSCSVEEIRDILLVEYNVDGSKCQMEVLQFIEKLAEMNLIIKVDD